MKNKKYLVTIVVPGRFHAFDLAKQLEKKKLLLNLITSIPSYFVIKRFKINRKFILSLPLREFFFRFISLFSRFPFKNKFINFFNFLFELQSSKKINYIKSDIVICWSGSAEEIFLRSKKKFKNLKILERGSSHIEFQHKILLEEHRKFNINFNEIDPKLILKEKREYQLADKIIVPSNFAKETFVNSGISEDKVIKIPLGVSLSQFHVNQKIIKKLLI